jgi:hypothetical protein
VNTSATVVALSAAGHAEQIVFEHAELARRAFRQTSPTEDPAVTPATQMPIREGSRDGRGGCVMCGKDAPSTRAKYCTRACQQRGRRLRHQTPTADLTLVRKALQRRKALVDHTIYECGQCGERFVGVRRCESCKLFCAALGVGGSCPECDLPVLVDDLLGEGVFASA